VAGFERHFDLTDRVPRGEALRIVGRSPLLPQMGYEGCDGVMGAKKYENMAARGPVLLFRRTDESCPKMIAGTRSGFMAESEDAALDHQRGLYGEWLTWPPPTLRT